MTDDVTRIASTLDAHIRTEPIAPERRAIQKLKEAYQKGDAEHGIVRNPSAARLLSAAQMADASNGYTDRAKGVSTQVHQAAGELMAVLGTDANPAEVIARKRTLLRRLRTVEILQLKAQWFK